jgi:DNA-binding transcriptional regulator YhcF (GntR family)
MRRPHARIRLDTTSGTPAYRQIADQVRTLIIEGVLDPGDPLPTVRRLALELGIHFNTVAEAYRTLAEENFVDITHGHGVRILDRTAPRAGPDVAENFRQKLRELIAAVRARGLTTRQITAELRTITEVLQNQ